MKSKYTEDALVKQPAIELFEKLGWKTYNGFHEFEQAGSSPLGREAKSEVLLVARLRTALKKLNPDLSKTDRAPLEKALLLQSIENGDKQFI